jgi:hypothetical protein
MKRRPVVITRALPVVFTISEDRPPKSVVVAAVSSVTSSSNRSTNRISSLGPYFAPVVGDQRLFFPEVVKTNLLQNAYNKKTMGLDPAILQLWVDP